MTLRDYFAVLRRRWLTVAIGCLVGVLLAVGATALMPRTYTAEATDWVRISDGSRAPDALYQSSQFALNIVGSYAQVADSDAVLQPVIDQLGLNLTVRQLGKQIKVTNPTNTVLLNVRASSPSAHQARAIANAVAIQLGIQIEKLSTDPGKQSPVNVTLSKGASLPLAPSSPRARLNYILGLLVGLAVGAGVAVLRNQLDTTIKSPSTLTDLTGAAPLGTVRFDPNVGDRPLVALDPYRPGVEDFRSIRTGLRFVDVDHTPRLIIVSSAIAEEGKSVTACNLAISLAQAGMRVCIVEGDLRLPKATAYLGVDGSVGFSDVVAGDLTLDEAMISWGHDNVTVLAAGTTPPDPNNLLGTEASKRVFHELRERFDMVIVDAPPVLPVSDAAILANLSDGVILVARHGHVHADQFLHAFENIGAAGGRVLGTILTQVPHKRGSGGYGYGYGYVSGGSATRDVQPRPARSSRPSEPEPEPVGETEDVVAHHSDTSAVISDSEPTRGGRGDRSAEVNGSTAHDSSPVRTAERVHADLGNSVPVKPRRSIRQRGRSRK